MFDRIYTVYRTWETKRRTFKELSRLTDAELSDIGIMRCDIPRIANKSNPR